MNFKKAENTQTKIHRLESVKENHNHKKIDKLDFSETYKICPVKITIQKTKRPVREGESGMDGKSNINIYALHE